MKFFNIHWRNNWFLYSGVLAGIVIVLLISNIILGGLLLGAWNKQSGSAGKVTDCASGCGATPTINQRISDLSSQINSINTNQNNFRQELDRVIAGSNSGSNNETLVRSYILRKAGQDYLENYSTNIAGGKRVGFYPISNIVSVDIPRNFLNKFSYIDMGVVGHSENNIDLQAEVMFSGETNRYPVFSVAVGNLKNSDQYSSSTAVCPGGYDDTTRLIADIFKKELQYIADGFLQNEADICRYITVRAVKGVKEFNWWEVVRPIYNLRNPTITTADAKVYMFDWRKYLSESKDRPKFLWQLSDLLIINRASTQGYAYNSPSVIRIYGSMGRDENITQDVIDNTVSLIDGVFQSLIVKTGCYYDTCY